MSTRAAKPWRRRKAASAVARKKGYGGTSKGFCPRRTLVRRGRPFYKPKAQPRGERRSSENSHLWMETN